MYVNLTSFSKRKSVLTLSEGETAALENSGRLHASAYRGATMYTT